MSYQHHFIDGRPCDLPAGKVVCVGKNYAAHAAELDSVVPDEPLLFIKPNTALLPLAEPFAIPADRGPCDHETEIAVLIGKPLTKADITAAQAAIAGVGLALDLTLRAVQQKLKTDGHAWEKCKAFDGSCPLSGFVDAGLIGDWQNIEFALDVNGASRQLGNSKAMATPVLELIAYISQWFTLLPGDVVLTGTPEGVAPLYSGDELKLRLGNLLEVDTGVL